MITHPKRAKMISKQSNGSEFSCAAAMIEIERHTTHEVILVQDDMKIHGVNK